MLRLIAYVVRQVVFLNKIAKQINLLTTTSLATRYSRQHLSLTRTREY